MGYVTKVDDFTGRYELPTDHPTAQSYLQDWIADREPEVLADILGVSLYQDLKTALDTDPVVDQPWADLVNGVIYDNPNVAGQKLQWKGLKWITTPFVYFYYTRKNASQTGQAGEGFTKVESATRTSPNDKQVWAWNDMVCQINSLYQYLDSLPADTFPSWVKSDLCYYKPLNIFGL